MRIIPIGLPFPKQTRFMPFRLPVVTAHLILLFLFTATVVVSIQASSPQHFVFGAVSNDMSGFPSNAQHVTPATTYNSQRGFGIESISADTPFSFSVNLPEGNYLVTFVFGDDTRATNTTVKAESRRLMLELVQTIPGEKITRVAAINIRNATLPPIPANAPGGDRVLISPSEEQLLTWDDKLTLEFLGDAPGVREITITPAPALPVVFLAGDSTVTDQPREPAASWGQMITRFFKPNVVIANHAKSGETMKSFISGLRLDKILSQAKAGDYLFIQFGHNDQKTAWPQTYVEAGTTYKAYLRVFVAEARLRGMTPVLVTSPQRRRFERSGKIRNTLGDYPEAVREIAREQKCALIDLEAMSRAFYEALGPDKSPLAFNDGGRDLTHHNNYGAYELAKMIAQSIRDQKLPLAAHLVDDIDALLRDFSPAHPDASEAVRIPASADPVVSRGGIEGS